MIIPQFGQIVPYNERKLLGGKPTPIMSPQTAPFMYRAFRSGIANNWDPREIPMGEDKHEYRDKLTDNERRQYDWCFSMLTTMDEYTGANISEKMRRFFTCPEGQFWCDRQAFEEALHTDSYQYIIESLGFEPEDVYTRFLKEESLYAKIMEAQGWTEQLDIAWEESPGLESDVAKRHFIKGYAGWGLGLEGGWFRNGFNMVFILAMRGMMKGTAREFVYILRDETLHFNTCINVLNWTQQNWHWVWDGQTLSWIERMFHRVVELEAAFAEEACKGVLGFSTQEYIQHVKYTLNSYASRLSMPKPFEDTRPLKWVDQLSGALRLETNFFENTVTEYQSAGELSWD